MRERTWSQMLLPFMIACRRFVELSGDLSPSWKSNRTETQPRRKHADSGRISHDFAGNSVPGARAPHRHDGKICGFSTFFSTVVENFGGRPYGTRDGAASAQDGDCNTRIGSPPNALDEARAIDNSGQRSVISKFL